MILLKRKCIVFLIMIYFSSVHFLLYAQTNELPKNPVNTFKLDSLSYYKTENKIDSIKYILGKYSSGDFKPVRQAVLNAGIPKQYYWIHFTITNGETAINSLILDIQDARLNELELFEMSDSTSKSLGKLGDFYSFSQRSIIHKNFIYAVSISPGQKKEYFLFVNQVGHTFTLPIRIYTDKTFRSISFNDYLFDGVTYGILLFVAIVSFLFFFTSKHYLYLFYGLYITTGIGWFLSYFGLGYQYIWGNYPPVNTFMPPVMASINILLNLQICQILLRLIKTNRLLNSILNFTKCALILSALFPLFFNLNKYGYTMNHSYLLFFLSAILFAMLIVSFSVILFATKGLITAKFYLIASLIKAAGIVNLALLELGITPAVYHMEEFLQIGIFVEITLLTYALAVRYTNFKARTFVKVIEAHENERLLISKDIHDSISSSLSGINFNIENFTRDDNHLSVDKRMQLEKIVDEFNKIKTEAKNISRNTMPEYIKENSIKELIEKYIDEINNKAKDNTKEKDLIQINFSANRQLNTFSEVVKLNIFRIIQEILTNILKHSKATSADILFSFSKKEIMIIAEDNGIGFNQTNSGSSKGMGVKNIRTRVELLDGNFVIKSPAYKRNIEEVASADSLNDSMEYGTMIKIRIPYRNNLMNKKTGYDY